MTTSDIAPLVLEDDAVFKDRAWGARGRTFDEIVFSIGVIGYQGTLTDPSYHRQIVVMAAPHIDNTSVNDKNPEFLRVWVAGFAMCDAVHRTSNWRSRRELEDELISQGIVDIADINTRVIARHIRKRGAMHAGIFSDNALPVGMQYLEDEAVASLTRIVVEPPTVSGVAPATEVSADEIYVAEPLGGFEGKEPIARVVAVDLSIKSRTPYRLAARGARVYVMLSIASFTDTEALELDGASFPNRPDGPSTADRGIGVLRAVLDAGIPYFGICFGHQFFDRALGYGTYKLDYGHHGINQPAKEVAMNHVEITAHNHGFAMGVPVGEPSVAPFEPGRYGRVEVSHVGLGDGVVKGLRTLDIPAFSA